MYNKHLEKKNALHAAVCIEQLSTVWNIYFTAYLDSFSSLTSHFAVMLTYVVTG